MALTFANARTIIQQAIADSSNPTFVDQCLNQAQRETSRARRWPELYVRDFGDTRAAYNTGTIATDGTTAVVLTGGVWPADIATGKWRFAKSVSSPWYEVVTRTDDTNIVLADAYLDDDETASEYIVYKSHYSLESAADRLEEIWIHTAGTAYKLEGAATDAQVSDFLHYPSGPGVPTHYYNMERDASGNRQILLGPATPDKVYRVEYVYKKQMTDDTFVGNLDESRWPVILSRALSLAYAPEFYERSNAEYAKYKILLNEEWSNESESETQGVRVGQNRVNYMGWTTGNEYLMGRGTVADPS